jgi:predicted DNA-binding protein
VEGAVATLAMGNDVRRKNFILSADLERRAGEVAKRTNKDFSQLIRDALHKYVEEFEREMLQRELAEGYMANANYYSSMNKQWEAADAE